MTLHDTEVVSFTDLSSHFYLNETDIGNNRGAACQTKLAELNPNVNVKFTDQPIDEELVLEHSVVVVCNVPLSEQLRISDLARYCTFEKVKDKIDNYCFIISFCRANNIPLIVADTRGLFGQVCQSDCFYLCEKAFCVN